MSTEVTRRGLFGLVAGTGAAAIAPVAFASTGTERVQPVAVRIRAKFRQPWKRMVMLDLAGGYTVSLSLHGEPVPIKLGSRVEVEVEKIGGEIVSLRRIFVDGKPLQTCHAELKKAQHSWEM